MSSDTNLTGAAQSAVYDKRAWTDDDLRAALPEPAADSNKYSRGKLFVIAGSKAYPGAACLAARASQRMGAGYTEVITSKAAIVPLLVSSPSLVVRDVKKWDPAMLANLKDGARHAVCIGPGFALGDTFAGELIVDVLKHAKCPVLVDGGGLSAISTKRALRALANRRENELATIITPHTGEASRLRSDLLLETSDPKNLAKALAMATGAIAVVKGPDTYISAGKRVYTMREGTPALAKAGTGDVLAGMISALLAQGVEPIAACILGTTLHARAGNIAAQTYTTLGVAAEDVINAIPNAIRTLTA